MQRRKFLTTASLLGLGGMTSSTTGCATGQDILPGATSTLPILPPGLKPGDRVALIAPAGAVTPERLARSVDNINRLGFTPVIGAHVLERRGYLAGTDEQRLADLYKAFEDPARKAVWAIRGGYGCTRLLPLIDWERLAKSPKLLIGYSDLTALLNAFRQRLGWTGVHGPMASSELDAEQWLGLQQLVLEYQTPPARLRANEEAAMMGVQATGMAQSPAGQDDTTSPLDINLHPGKVRGELAGGNLTVLAAMAGTPYAVDFTDKIVLLEDIGEKPYRIDRMLTQLVQSGLNRARGIVLGEWVDCDVPAGSPSLTLAEVLRDCLEPLGIPVLGQFSFGHGVRNQAYPIGVFSELDGENRRLTILNETVTAG